MSAWSLRRTIERCQHRNWGKCKSFYDKRRSVRLRLLGCQPRQLNGAGVLVRISPRTVFVIRCFRSRNSDVYVYVTRRRLAVVDLDMLFGMLFEMDVEIGCVREGQH